MYKFTLGGILLAMTVAGTLPAQEVDFWSGGAGMESREQAPLDNNVAIEFFAQDGAFLAEIYVTLYDHDGNVLLETLTEGPWLVVDLEPGQYSVAGTRVTTGETQSVRFDVGDEGGSLIGLRYREG